MKKIITLNAVLVLFATAAFAAGGKGARGELKAGFSQVDITPPIGAIITGPAAPIEIAVCSDILCNLEQIAIKLNRKLCWDPAREVFVNDDEANRMLDRPMHNGWKL
jgi:hypothetical protein